jgi:type I restriction enzyme S subunit
MNSNLTTIGKVATIYDGPHATPKKTKKGPYYLSISSLVNGTLDLSQSAHLSDEDYQKWTKRVTPSKGDILFSYETRLGEAALMPDGIKACLGRRMGILRPDKSKVLPEFLLYAYLSPAFQNTIKANTITGATVNRISLNDLQNFEIRIPSLKEQTEVSNLLAAVDLSIETNDKITNILLNLIRNIYDYWFKQYEFLIDSKNTYRHSGGKFKYSQDLKRDIPNDWEVANLFKNEFTEIIKPGINKFDGKKEYIATADVDGIKIKQGSSISFTTRESRANMQPIQNSIWFAKMENSIKHMFIGSYSDDIVQNSIFSTGFMGLLVRDKYFYYVASYILDPYFEKVKDLNAHGATMSGIGNIDLKNIKILLPNEAVIDRYNDHVKGLFNQIDLIRQENKILSNLRDWLLPMLMTGQLSIGEK